MSKVRRETVAEQGLDILRSKILDGELRPGDPVTEEAMAKAIGVSRPTMREVLRMLVSEGLLIRHPTTRILQVTTLTAEEVSEIYAARRLLELAGLDAASDLPREAFANLEQTLADMAAAVEAKDVYGLVRADGQCHSETVALTGNRYLTALHSSLMSKINLNLALVESTDPLDNVELLQSHRDYVNLIVDGQIDEAKRQLVQRLESAEREVLRVFNAEGRVVAGRRSLKRNEGDS